MRRELRKLGFAAVLVAAVSLAAVLPASAHILKSDNGVTAELHVPPYDQPIAGEVTRLQFTFEDMPSTFSAAACGCQVRIAGPDNDSQTVSVRLDAAREDRLTSDVTFAHGGPYQITLVGSTTSARTSRFSLQYQETIARPPTRVSSRARKTSIVLIYLSLAAAVVVLAWYFIPQRRSSK